MKQRQLKGLIKTKTESGNCFCIRVFWIIKLRLIVMSTNLEYRARERQRKREKRQASETQREKGRQRFRARDKKQRRHFLLEEQHEHFVAAVTMLAATNARRKWAAVKKKWTRTRTTFPPYKSFRKFHVVVVQNNGKEMYKKSVLHLQSCFFAN